MGIFDNFLGQKSYTASDFNWNSQGGLFNYDMNTNKISGFNPLTGETTIMDATNLSNPEMVDQFQQSTGLNILKNQDKGFLGLSGSTWAGIGTGIQGLSGLANAYLGWKSLEQAKKQFSFQKGLANRNLANQAKIINNTYDNAASIAAGLTGRATPEVVASYRDAARAKHVDGSPIG